MGPFVLVLGCVPSSPPQSGPQATQPQAQEVTLKVVKLGEFEEALARHKGHVIVVDFWATFCPPCMKEFPRLVEMHKKYGPEGLVCISMSLDKPDEPEDRETALGFLKSRKATFENFLIDEKPRGPTGWADRWGFANPPAVHVYGRDGKLAKKFVNDTTESFEYTEVEPFVLKLLRDGR